MLINIQKRQENFQDAEYGIEMSGGFGRCKVYEKKEEKKDKSQSSLFDF